MKKTKPGRAENITLPEPHMIMTKEQLRAGLTNGLGINYDQLKIFGEQCPPLGKWKKRLLEKVITKIDYALFLSLRGLSPKLRAPLLETTKKRQ